MRVRQFALSQPYLNLLFMGIALTLFFFGWGNWRINIIYPVPVPMLFLGLVFITGILVPLFLQEKPSINFSTGQYKTLARLCCLFLLWHILAVIPSPQKMIAIKEVSKLSVGLVSFWTVLALFPRDRKFLERFWRTALWCAMPLILYMIYKNIFVYNRNYITTNIESGAHSGRNILAWFVSIVLPFAFFNFWMVRRKLNAGLLLSVLMVAWLLIGSRSGWFAGAAGILCGCLVVWRVNELAGYKLALAALVTLGTSLWFISQFTNTQAIFRRFTYLYNPSAVPELHSYQSRLALIAVAWNAFLSSPLIGDGLGANGHDPHNDFFSILADTGIVGGALFLAIFFVLGKVCLGWPQQSNHLNWTSVASRGAFVGIMIFCNTMDIYTSSHVWIILALSIVALDIERRMGQDRLQAAKA